MEQQRLTAEIAREALSQRHEDAARDAANESAAAHVAVLREARADRLMASASLGTLSRTLRDAESEIERDWGEIARARSEAERMGLRLELERDSAAAELESAREAAAENERVRVGELQAAAAALEAIEARLAEAEAQGEATTRELVVQREQLREGLAEASGVLEEARRTTAAQQQATSMTFARELQGIEEEMRRQLAESIENARLAKHWAKRTATAAAERRDALRELRRLQGNVRVFCRLRPLPSEKAKLVFSTDLDGAVELRPPTEGGGANPANGGGARAAVAPAASAMAPTVITPASVGRAGSESMVARSWEFDRAFGGETSQEAMFEEIRTVATSVMDGFSVCVMAYGATGTPERPADSLWRPRGSSLPLGLSARTPRRLTRLPVAKRGIEIVNRTFAPRL